MTSTMQAPPAVRRRRNWRWIGAAILAIVALAAVTAWLTAPRPGGRMDPASTSADGAHALVTLLRDQGVDVVVADTVAEAEHAARPDSLLLIAQTGYMPSDELLRRLIATPGDRLLIEPTSRTREALAAELRVAPTVTYGGEPDCDLPEATRAGSAQFGPTDTYELVADSPVTLTRCYSGAVVRYRDDGHTVTVAGTAEFMTNSSLLREGNAALAMNLAGTRPRLVWYAPQHVEGENSSSATIFDLIPARVGWAVWQLWLAVGLVALWKGRRLGPLVAERLPVVVRASETVEGRGRLYRSRRARDRAADALRTATLQRLAPRLGLGNKPDPGEVVQAVAQRTHKDPNTLVDNLFGSPPSSDNELLQLAHALDDIERQVAHS
ncbi:DUF4350 domain-containing protein [Mycolicibacterium mengxianglii]|uniref:DUF4350 domain-containing protein n=1 Tax=Mycolicibacterium mengxianglii TaxID=2736649 RepID=UPI0018D17F99|nr:DUF4350 domain-containing protein [Mycolicibacterium mengxianglii]